MSDLQNSILPQCAVVSIHDAHPGNVNEVDAMLADLARAGVDRTSLLVIPNYHHRFPISEAAGFGAWLADRRQAGHEIVLHGYYHLRLRRPGESVLQKVITRVYTAEEGEFYDIGGDEATARLTRGLEDLAACGVQPAGFIAPAWLLSPAGEAAARRLGLQYTTRLGTINDLVRQREFRTQSLVYSVRNAWRTAVSLRWNARLLRRLAGNPVIRLGLHPPDFRVAEVRRQILDIAGRLAGARRIETYLGWLDLWRCHAPTPALAGSPES